MAHTQAISTKSEDEVERTSSELDGVLASKLFRLFENGKSLIDVVIEEKLPPEAAEKYYEKWAELNCLHPDARLSTLWNTFNLCECLDRLTHLTMPQWLGRDSVPEYLEHKNRLRELLVQIIIATSETSMEDANKMLEITQKDRKWTWIEEFYPETDTGYIEELERIWNYHNKD